LRALFGMTRNVLNFRDFDWILFGLAIVIAAIGVVEIYSTTSHSAALASQYKKQIYWIILSGVVALVVSRLDYHMILEQIPWLYGASILALVLLLVKGHSVAGVRRWISLGGVLTFQVSEFVKLVIILLVAALLADHRGKSVTWKDLLKLGGLVGLPALLVALEPDLGTALTFFPIAAAGVLLAGIRLRQVLVLALAGVLMLPVAWHFARPYQRERVMSFIHPKQDTRGASYQSTQSKIAIGSGGLWGKGVGNGTQSQLGFIPVSHADFIFAAFSEEQGFAGTLFVLMLYFALLLRLLDSAQMAGDRAGTLVLVGFTALLFFQIAVNVGMMIGLFPVTGIPLPLMSQGGSSVLSTFLGLGLAMSVRMRRLVY
jgi:rod shape determining protein RodA